MKLVLDASVVVKWFFSSDPAEQDTAKALALLKGLQRGQYTVYQPVHWLVEVYAVVAWRSSADAAQQALGILHALELDIIDQIDIDELAGRLARQYQHHLFDTLYHAVALERGALLVTADEKYWQKAQAQGQIALLAQLD